MLTTVFEARCDDIMQSLGRVLIVYTGYFVELVHIFEDWIMHVFILQLFNNNDNDINTIKQINNIYVSFLIMSTSIVCVDQIFGNNF